MAAEFPLLGQALSIELANTRWVHGGREIDALRAPSDARRWLEAVGPRLAPAGWADADVAGLDVDDALTAQLVALRESVRDLFGAVATGVVPPPGVLDRMAAVSRAAPSWLEGSAAPGEGVLAHRRRRGEPGAALLATLADDATTLAAGPEAGLLRACPGPGCIGFFSQDSARRKFCSPTCSTRGRVARHYFRRREG